jgi:Fe-S cluster biogenesis protein NfuA
MPPLLAENLTKNRRKLLGPGNLGQPLALVTTAPNRATLDPVREKAAAVIAEVLAPLIEADGGRVTLIDVSADRVVIELSGTCKGCPGQPYTVSRIIEPAMRRALGANVEVETRFAQAVP